MQSPLVVRFASPTTKGVVMLVATTWKIRPLSPEQANRMMQTWGKLEAAMAENSSVERVCWYMYADGTGGVSVEKYVDIEAANAFGLEASLALGEFLEFESHIALDLDAAMPAILKAMDHVNG